MKKMEMNLSEKFIEPFFKVLGKHGVAEAIVNLFMLKEENSGIFPEERSKRKARVEFYCPDAFFEELKSDIVEFAKKKRDTFNLEILGLEEKINILTNEERNRMISKRRVSCL